MYLLRSLIINYEILIQFNSWLERDVSTAKWPITQTVQHSNTINGSCIKNNQKKQNKENNS